MKSGKETFKINRPKIMQQKVKKMTNVFLKFSNLILEVVEYSFI